MATRAPNGQNSGSMTSLFTGFSAALALAIPLRPDKEGKWEDATPVSFPLSSHEIGLPPWSPFLPGCLLIRWCQGTAVTKSRADAQQGRGPQKWAFCCRADRSSSQAEPSPSGPFGCSIRSPLEPQSTPILSCLILPAAHPHRLPRRLMAFSFTTCRFQCASSLSPCREGFHQCPESGCLPPRHRGVCNRGH